MSRRLPPQRRAIAHADTRRGNLIGGLKFLFALLLSHICEKGLSVGLFVTVNLVGAHKKHSFLH